MDGEVLTDIGGGNDGATVLAIQPDGRIVVAGYSARSAGQTFALARFLTDGELDPSFAGNGIATTAFRGGDASAEAIAIQPDGDVVVAGTANRSATGWDFALARYRSDGSLDPSFGHDGRVTTDFDGGGDAAYGLVLQGNKIVVAGESGGDFALARYASDGRLDKVFSGDGRVTTDFAGHADVARSVAAVADGRIVAAGYATQVDQFGTPSPHLALARYTTNGALDPSFAGDGTMATIEGASAWSVIPQPWGKVLVAGGGYELVLARYRSNGSPDPTFGDGGIVQGDRGMPGPVRSAAVQTEGKIVAAGFSTNYFGENFELTRWNANGTRDATFGDTWTDFGVESYDRARGVAIDPDGKIVVAGRSKPEYDVPGDFAVARYRIDSEGAPDRDADGFPDDGDQCPDRYGSTQHGCPQFDTTLTIRYSNADRAFEGRISSSADICAERAVAVYRVQRGPDRRIGSGYYAGDYAIDAPRRSGRYYARVSREFSAAPVQAICRGARSRTMGLRK